MIQGNASSEPVSAACDSDGSPAKASHFYVAGPLLAAWGQSEGARPGARVESTGRRSVARNRDVYRFRVYAMAIGRAFARATEPKHDDDTPKAKRIDPLISAMLTNAGLRGQFRRIAAAGADDADGADLVVGLDRHPRQGRFILRLTPKFLDYTGATRATELAQAVCRSLGFRIVLADIIRSAHRPNKGAITLHIERKPPAQVRAI